MKPSRMIVPLPNTAANNIWHRLIWLGVFAVAMGLLEAICVIYLRKRLPVVNQLPALTSGHLHLEVIREVCTIVMLLGVAWLAGINWRSRLACFFYTFGIWDILYYVGLWWLGHWPDSLLTWDCLFLIPKPWYGPVLAPVLISLYFVLGCCWLHARERRGTPVRLSVAAVGSQLLAFAVWYWSFVKDSDWIVAHKYEGVSYSWLLFAAGALIGVAGLWLTAATTKHKTEAAALNHKRQLWQPLAAASLFALAMGLLEAICVIYLRRLNLGCDIGQSLRRSGLLTAEIVREICTVVMLVAAGYLAGFNRRSRTANFFSMFGLWNISYYVGLTWWAQRPPSWLGWNCLFLIPQPWHGPVLAVVLISGYFVVACGVLLARETTAPLRFSTSAGLLHLLALVVWYCSFVKDSGAITARIGDGSGYSGLAYSWLLLACGMISAVWGLWFAARPPIPAERRLAEP